MLRRLPRRLDRISGSLERGRLGLNVRLLADAGDRRYLTGLAHQFVLTFLAATLGVMAVLMLGLHGGPNVTHKVTLRMHRLLPARLRRHPRATRARTRVPARRLRGPATVHTSRSSCAMVKRGGAGRSANASGVQIQRGALLDQPKSWVVAQ